MTSLPTKFQIKFSVYLARRLIVAQTAVKPALVLSNKLVLKTGVHNGIDYGEPEVKKLYLRYKEIESKSLESRSTDEVHAFDIFKGGDEDHKDSSGTWIGSVEGVYWDDVAKGFGFKTWNIVDEDFARKISYQKQRGKSSFGVSPRLNVLRVGTTATEIIPKNIAIVLNPAGGGDLMLSGELSTNDNNYEERQDVIQELTLSERESISSAGGDLDMADEKAILDAIGKLGGRLDEIENARKKKEEDEKISKLQKENEELKVELAKKKKKDDEEEMSEEETEETQAKKKKKDEEEMAKKKKKDEEEEMAKKKKDEEDEKMAGKDKDRKYKYYGALSGRDSLVKQFSLTPDLKQLDATSVNRIAEDVIRAAKVFDGEFTLEQAQKGIEELQVILVNLPTSEKEEKELMTRVEETLSTMSGQIADKLGERTGSNAGGRRKGLIPDGSERTEEALSDEGKKQGSQRNADVVKGELASLLVTGLGIDK